MGVLYAYVTFQEEEAVLEVLRHRHSYKGASVG